MCNKRCVNENYVSRTIDYLLNKLIKLGELLSAYFMPNFKIGLLLFIKNIIYQNKIVHRIY